MKQILVVLVLLVACAGLSLAQTPMTLSVGPTAGLLIPTGEFVTGAGTWAGTGWNVGAVGKLGSVLPFGAITASVLYAQLPTNPSGDYHLTEFQVNAGAEYNIPMEGVAPYVGLDLIFTSLSSNFPNSTSRSREGLGLGVGAIFMDNIDVSAKYQMINLVGKDTGENSIGQIGIKVAYLFKAM